MSASNLFRSEDEANRWCSFLVAAISIAGGSVAFDRTAYADEALEAYRKRRGMLAASGLTEDKP